MVEKLNREDAMRRLWQLFCAAHPDDPDLFPWDELTEFERNVMRATMEGFANDRK